MDIAWDILKGIVGWATPLIAAWLVAKIPTVRQWLAARPLAKGVAINCLISLLGSATAVIVYDRYFLARELDALRTQISAEGPAVGITDIHANAEILGTVVNLPNWLNGSACVVVFIHTDKWYIHPTANAGLGKSFATVVNGTWHLPTVAPPPPPARGQQIADHVAAVLMGNVDNCSNVPIQLENINTLSLPTAIVLTIYDLATYDSSRPRWLGRL